MNKIDYISLTIFTYHLFSYEAAQNFTFSDRPLHYKRNKTKSTVIRDSDINGNAKNELHV